MKIIGIDPGKKGAIAFYDTESNSVEVLPLPWKKKENRLDAYQLRKSIDSAGRIDGCFIEKVSAMPRQGVVSMFTFGKAFGSVVAVCESLGLDVQLVTPQRWKKGVMVEGKHGKQDAVRLCYDRFPDINLLKTDKSRVPSTDMAEAALIALYGSSIVS